MGTSESTFKCILKKKDEVPKHRYCSTPALRTQAKNQFKAECRFTTKEQTDFELRHYKVSEILPECGRLSKCCCMNKDFRKREMCLPSPQDLRHVESFFEDQHWVISPDTRQGFASCAEWVWDPSIPLDGDLAHSAVSGQSSATRAGYRCTQCRMEFACGGQEVVDCAKVQERYHNQANHLWYASFVQSQDHPLFDRIPRWVAAHGKTLFKSIAIGQCASESGTSIRLERGECPHNHFSEDDYCLCRELC